MNKIDLPTVDEAGVIALEIITETQPEISFNDQAFFVAGFQECIKWMLPQFNTDSEADLNSLRPTFDLQNKWNSVGVDEKLIMGRPNFTCGAIANRLRTKGFSCQHKSEEEQSLVIFTMLQFHKEYGPDWSNKMLEYINENLSSQNS